VSEILSLNLSLPREVRDGDRTLRTSIFKEPVTGRRMLRRTHLEGDGQADLENHGGRSKAVCVYSHDHYAYWERELGLGPLPCGQFGENLTVRGLTEEEVHIGDVFRVGGAKVEISQPRVSCFKLGIRMGSSSFPKLFLASLRTGFYLRVLEEGELGAGDALERLALGPGRIAVREACRLLHFERGDRERIRRVISVPALSAEWRRSFEKLLGL